MSDIVERLRAIAERDGEPRLHRAIIGAAADEIERLRKTLGWIAEWYPEIAASAGEQFRNCPPTPNQPMLSAKSAAKKSG